VTRAYQYRRWRQGRRRPRGRTQSGNLLLFGATPAFILIFALVIGVVGASTAYYNQVHEDVHPLHEAIDMRGGGARIFDRNGVLLYEFLDEDYGRQERVSLDEMSEWVKIATIASEDASFYSNPGVNPRGLARAALENLRPGDDFMEGTGGSSITQQLIKQIYFDPDERAARSYDRKLREIILALEFNRDYSKDQILEWYLNEIPYGGVFIGIEAASQGYFSIPASELSLAQAAFLAGLPQSPADHDPFTNFRSAKHRQHEVIDLMVKHGFIDRELGNWAKLERIELEPKPWPLLAPHWVQYVGDHIRMTMGDEALYRSGLDVVTTLDLELQDDLNEVLERHLQTYEHMAGGHNGSIVAIEPETGQILVMIGSRDYFREDIDGHVNNALGLNSPGSALKPFTYTATLEMGWSPEWPIVDTRITYREPGGPAFSPTNPAGGTSGVMPMRRALGNSLNIPAFKAILWAGVPETIETMKRMGITTLDRELGPSLTLGGVDVRLIDMVYGYSVFANYGEMVGVPAARHLPDGNRKLDPVPILTITRRNGEVIVDNTQPMRERVLGAEYAYLMTDILHRDENRTMTFGVGSNLNIPGFDAAVKTGTSAPFEDSSGIGETWAIGYTQDIAIGVWIGNADNTPMNPSLTSGTIAGQTWHDSMVRALHDKEPREWERPPGIVEATVCVPSGLPPVPGTRCPTVTGLFAAEALERMREGTWWGGKPLTTSMPASQLVSRIPAEITGWRRYLAEEYLRHYRAGGGSSGGNQTSSPGSSQPWQPPPPPGPPGQQGGGPPGQQGGGPPGQGGGGPEPGGEPPAQEPAVPSLPGQGN
jgi:membrane peptidoglycan carboxypeptidase